MLEQIQLFMNKTETGKKKPAHNTSEARSKERTNLIILTAHHRLRIDHFVIWNWWHCCSRFNDIATYVCITAEYK